MAKLCHRRHLLPSLSFPLVILLVLGCTLLLPSATRTLAQDSDSDDAEKTATATTITCLGGWAGDAQQQHTIPRAWINDGYCDCPFDGKDEPDTNACSGSTNWPGVDSPDAGSPGAENNDFVCPQQPNLILPASRVNDGICDCCDGKDEEGNASSTTTSSNCADICDDVLRADRERLAKITSDYLDGSRKRDIDLANFAKLRDSKIAEGREIDKQLGACNADIALITGTKLVQLKRQYVFSRMAAMKDIAVSSPMAAELLGGLENTELEELIVHLCQVSGEIAKGDGTETSGNTCSALRVAALDLGLSWNDEEDFDNYETKMEGKVNMTRKMIETIFENAMDADSEDGSPALPSLRWKASSNNGRRRLDAVMETEDGEDNEDIHEMFDDDYMAAYHDAHHDDRDHEHEHHRRNDNSDEQRDNESPPKGKEEEFMNEIQNSLFSKARAKFLTQSDAIIAEISKVLDAPSPQANDDETDAGGKEEAQSESESKKGDHFIVRNKLREKQDAIRRGLRWGASAKLLFAFSSLRKSNENLKRLAIGTIFYGQISAVQVWQILQSVMPEYKSLFGSESESGSGDEEENTCASPWSNHCPPKRIVRKVSNDGDASSEMEYPPPFLLDAAKEFCDGEALMFFNAGGETPACSNDLHGLLASPVNVVDYDVPTRRNQEKDPFQSMFAPIISLPIDAEGWRSLEDEKKTKETEQRELQKSINDIWKAIGGVDGTDLGRDGEIHAIANDCFEIAAGKYTYEMCLFGRAQQKEGSNKSGTNLGDFKGIEYIDSKDSPDATSTRVLKWEGGAKCWNGPQRSATVYMKCGIDHKIISADEPDTCRYVFEMETYLACDDDHKVRMGL
eukprot:jgi/Psemu1/326827/estExt_fgenesh1_pg.C_4770010